MACNLVAGSGLARRALTPWSRKPRVPGLRSTCTIYEVGAQAKGSCALKVHPRKCAAKVQPMKCAAKVDPRKCAAKVDPRKCAAKVDPRKCAAKVTPRKCAAKVNTRKCAAKVSKPKEMCTQDAKIMHKCMGMHTCIGTGGHAQIMQAAPGLCLTCNCAHV